MNDIQKLTKQYNKQIDVVFGWVIVGVGPAVYGWHQVLPDGGKRFLGKNQKQVCAQLTIDWALEACPDIRAEILRALWEDPTTHLQPFVERAHVSATSLTPCASRMQ